MCGIRSWVREIGGVVIEAELGPSLQEWHPARWPPLLMLSCLLLPDRPAPCFPDHYSHAFYIPYKSGCQARLTCVSLYTWFSLILSKVMDPLCVNLSHLLPVTSSVNRVTIRPHLGAVVMLTWVRYELFIHVSAQVVAVVIFSNISSSSVGVP